MLKVSGTQRTYQVAVTLTLKPKLFTESVDEQYQRAKLELNVLKNVYNLRLTLVVEFTKSYNVHLHGFCDLPMKIGRKNPCHRLYDIFRDSKVFGFACIKECTEDNIWLEYISKNLTYTTSELSHSPIMFDDFDRFGFGEEFAEAAPLKSKK